MCANLNITSFFLIICAKCYKKVRKTYGNPVNKFRMIIFKMYVNMYYAKAKY